ncbi:MAG: ATP-binding protein [Casimicrobiaceae bacterium]
MIPPGLVPASLAQRFAIAAAALAAGALLIISLTSWWLIDRQRQEGLQQLAAHEREFYAAAVGSDLRALATRMSEVASSTILATGLVDSQGRDTYLTPFLAGIRQINGIPVEVVFTDFEGQEISSNGSARFSPVQLQWLRQELAAGRAGATIFPVGADHELVAVQPLNYARTSSPEGALFYKIALGDVHVGPAMLLTWGETAATAGDSGTRPATRVPVPDLFVPLRFTIQGPPRATSFTPALRPQYLPVLVVTLLLFGAVVVAGLQIAKRLTRDLSGLEAFSSKVVSSGFSHQRAPVSGSTEVAGLAASINGMLERLHEQHDALLRDREKLAELAHALKDADQRKDEFLATLSHELRNPLAPLRNSLHLLGKSGQIPTAQLYAMMERQLNHLVRLVDDLLETSRISRGTLVLRKQPVPLAEIVRNAVETSQPLVAAANHVLTVSVPEVPLWIDGDPVRLAQILANLLNNAATYTPPGGRVSLTARREDDEVAIVVRDNGDGIPPDELARLFQMFSRGRGSMQRGEGGLGIGLALARRLAEMHGGTIEARSGGSGQGSEFTLRLPVGSGVSHDVPLPTPAPASVARRILVVDDNRDAADSLAMILQTLGADVRVAHDGPAAIALFADTDPAIVLLDIGMPGMDGYEVARRIRADFPDRRPMIVALTGWGQERDRDDARAAGFDDHLTKPVEIDVLERLLGGVAAVQRCAP